MVAGKFVNIHHNVFELTSDSAFSIQGYPRRYARFCKNWCAAPNGGAAHGDNEGVVFCLDDADVRVKNNRYDTVTPGRQWLKQLSRQLAQRSDEVLSPKPSLAALGLGLDIQSPPVLSASPSAATTASPSSPSPPSQHQSARNPITGTPLTPVGGDQ